MLVLLATFDHQKGLKSQCSVRQASMQIYTKLAIKIAVLSGVLGLRLWQTVFSKCHLCTVLVKAYSLLCASEQTL